MSIKKIVIVLVSIFVSILFIPYASNATDYVVALDAGHSFQDFQQDIDWFEEVNGQDWDYSKWGDKPDYDNPITGINNTNTSEAALTKKTVVYMMEYLKQYDNIKVIVCPRTGENHYSDRPFYARDNKADVHLSMHYNASIDGSRSYKGSMTIYKTRRFKIAKICRVNIRFCN